MLETNWAKLRITLWASLLTFGGWILSTHSIQSSESDTETVAPATLSNSASAKDKVSPPRVGRLGKPLNSAKTLYEFIYTLKDPKKKKLVKKTIAIQIKKGAFKAFTDTPVRQSQIKKGDPLKIYAERRVFSARFEGRTRYQRILQNALFILKGKTFKPNPDYKNKKYGKHSWHDAEAITGKGSITVEHDGERFNVSLVKKHRILFRATEKKPTAKLKKNTPLVLEGTIKRSPIDLEDRGFDTYIEVNSIVFIHKSAVTLYPNLIKS